MQTPASFTEFLQPYIKSIEEKIRQEISNLGPKNSVRDACEYALLNGGKRFRPALALMIADALGYGMDVFQAALGIEYFHTASLIADDLPCMDNDDERRNKPSVHRIYGETTALLATYALISAGYACIAKNANSIKLTPHPYAFKSDYLCVLALENAAYNTGLYGATGGQFLDLYPKDNSRDVLLDSIRKKTVTLFEISFVFGWLFGGGDPTRLNLVKQSAAHFGMAFQIADDIDDREQDLINSRSINTANLFGVDLAEKMFHEELSSFYLTLAQLQLDGGDIKNLGLLLAKVHR
jgi:geranylgeranyl diphosphate synthase type II